MCTLSPRQLVVRELVDSGAQADVADKFGTTALIWACRKGHHSVVELLVADYGVDVNRSAKDGVTPVICLPRVDTATL